VGDNDKGRTPADFRELLKEQYEVPEEARKGKRRQRRQARRRWKESRRAVTKQVLEEERRREPMTAAGAAVMIAVILLIGFAATHWWDGNDDDTKPKTVTSGPTPAVTEGGEGSAPSSPDTSASPSPSATVDLSSPDRAAEGWARTYLTRNPPVDEKHQRVVERAAPWMTDSLTRNLVGNDDKLWNDLVSNGGIAKVTAVDVNQASEGLPVDTPLRVWREVTVKTAIDGYKQYDQTTVLQTELTHSGDKWRVSRVLGV